MASLIPEVMFMFVAYVTPKAMMMSMVCTDAGDYTDVHAGFHGMECNHRPCLGP